MLAYCLHDGLTCSMKVYRRGDIFVLPKTMEGDFGGLNASQLATKQRKIYRRELFRWPTNEEVVMAVKDDSISLSELSPTEALLYAKTRGEDGAELQHAAEVLKNAVLKKHPELADKEEEVEEPTAPVESVGSVTEYVTEESEEEPEPESEEETTKKKATSRKSAKKG